MHCTSFGTCGAKVLVCALGLLQLAVAAAELRLIGMIGLAWLGDFSAGKRSEAVATTTVLWQTWWRVLASFSVFSRRC